VDVSPAAPGGPEELVDIVDADDQVLAVVPRSRMRAENLRHRSVGIMIVNHVGEILIHRRADTKDVWPGWWDLAVGGVVASGESYDDAARRELAEEVGVEAVALDHLSSGHYEDDDVRAIVHTYCVVWDGPVVLNDGEVVEACWVGMAELRRRVATDRFVPDSLAIATPLLHLDV
jgi:isopentenyldiphosphate isomerase